MIPTVEIRSKRSCQTCMHMIDFVTSCEFCRLGSKNYEKRCNEYLDLLKENPELTHSDAMGLSEHGIPCKYNLTLKEFEELVNKYDHIMKWVLK